MFIKFHFNGRDLDQSSPLGSNICYLDLSFAALKTCCTTNSDAYNKPLFKDFFGPKRSFKHSVALRVAKIISKSNETF